MRPPLGPRLFLRHRKDHPSVWYIRDGYRMQSTGLPEGELEAAQSALRTYAGSRAIALTIPNMKRPEIVYFATCESEDFPIKIGAATDVRRRLDKLQGGLPFRVILLATAPGGLVRERKLHIAFRESRLYGEWFSRTAGLMNAIGFYSRRNRVDLALAEGSDDEECSPR